MKISKYVLNTFGFTLIVSSLFLTASASSIDSIREAWKRYYEHITYTPQNESANKVAVDDSGYVFIAGDAGIKRYDPEGNETLWQPVGYLLALDKNRSHVYVVGYDVRKYDRLGNLIWNQSHGGSTISSIVVDSAGCILLTGGLIKPRPGVLPKWFTMRFDSSGALLWSTLTQSDAIQSLPNSLTFDSNTGNVYITGSYQTIKYNIYGQITLTSNIKGNIIRCAGDGNVYIVTSNQLMKLDSSFNQIWIDSSVTQDIVLDKHENLYVTGQSGTRKLSPEGTILWENLLSGSSITIDDSMNVYVTGTHNDTVTLADYRTVKYDSNGVLQWDVFYNGTVDGNDYSNSVAVDGVGNVYVTGGSSGIDSTTDYLTIKYNKNGSEQWIRRFGRPPIQNPSVAIAQAMAIDNSGNIILTGNNSTIQYTPFGTQVWETNSGLSYDTNIFGYGRAKNIIAVDDIGNVYLTGLFRDSMKTMKYSNTGSLLWATTFQGEASPNALDIDKGGNTVVIGTLLIPDSNNYDRDFITVKYNSAGEEQWVTTYDGPSESFSNDIPRALVVDESGNIYVTGESDSLDADYVTIKYNPDGVQEWIARFDGGIIDAAVDIALDTQQNIFVTGSSYDSLTFFDYVTISYAPDGTQRWTARYAQQWTCQQLPDSLRWICDSLGWSDSISTKFSDIATALIVDQDGNTYVTGTFGIGIPMDESFSASYQTVKYDPSGAQQWVSRYSNWFMYGGGVNDTIWEYPNSIAADSSGNVYVSGECSQSDFYQRDFVTLKYSPEGVQQLITITDGFANSLDRHAGMVIDNSGNIYVAGTSENANASIYTIIKYEQVSTSVLTTTTLPVSYKLHQNYPNPFNPSTTIRYELPSASHVTLKVYNVLGQEVATLVNEKREAGKHTVEFSAEGGSASGGNAGGLSSGVYFYRIQSGAFTQTRKFILLR